MRERNEKRKGREREIVRGSVRIKSIKKKVFWFWFFFLNLSNKVIS